MLILNGFTALNGCCSRLKLDTRTSTLHSDKLGDYEFDKNDGNYGMVYKLKGKDIFLHISALEEAGIDTLQEGEAVSFEIGENRGKENATSIKKV